VLPRSLSLPPTPSRCPPGPVVAWSRLSASRASVARAPPLSSIAQQRRRHARWPGPATSRSTLPTAMQGPPLRSFSCPHTAPGRPPPFSLAAPCTRAPSKVVGRRPRFPSSLFFSSIRSARCCLPAPHRACLCCPLVASPPHHRKSEPPSASIFRLLGEPVHCASWLVIGVHLTLSLLLWHCRTPPPMPLVIGAPPPPLDIAAPPPILPRTSSRCSGEP
jgi:hypothetical protein